MASNHFGHLTSGFQQLTTGASGTLHWNSPAGGGGPGFCRVSGPLGTNFAASTPPVIHSVQISHLSDENIDRLVNFLNVIFDSMMTAPEFKVVYVKNTWWPTRLAPGAVQLEKVVNFTALGAIVQSVILLYQDLHRSDLTGAQIIGRTSLMLLLAAGAGLTGAILLEAAGWIALLAGIGLVAASIIAPKKTDEATAWLFSNKDPFINLISNIIIDVGKIQDWSTRSGVINVT